MFFSDLPLCFALQGHRRIFSVSAVAESAGKCDAELQEPVPPVTPILSDPPLTSSLSA